MTTRNRAFLALAAGIAAAGLLRAQALEPPPPPSQSSTAQIKTPVKNFAVQTTADYLGTVDGKTVVRLGLTSPEIAKALTGKGIKQYSMTLRGSIQNAAGSPVESIKYPFSGSLAAGEPVHFSFLRALAPGHYTVEIDLGDGVKTYATLKFPIDVPETGRAFAPEMAPGDFSTLPSAEAVVMAAPAEPPAGGSLAAAAERVKIVPPDREAPVGLMRLSAEVKPPVTKVEFYLDDKLLLSRNRPPYTVEIDLGKVPRKQTVRVIGYDAHGNLVDEDAWALNEGDAKIAVRILPIPAPDSTGGVTVRIAVQSINGGEAKVVDLYLDQKRVYSFTAPPYVTVIPAAQYAAASFLRATAVTAEGQEANDLRFLKGQGAAMENVKVDVVQLHVSALDRAGHFVPGLTEGDFSIVEDKKPQKLISFEVAKNLPLNIGLVVDGSGSMRKTMDFVHTAGSDLFRDLIKERDRGFVIEFRETPQLLCAPTSNVQRLNDAVYATNASGQTALYDSVILGLYQFRATTGRKALVVISDGGDNHSWVDYDTLLRYTRTIGVPIYVIGVDIGMTEFGVRSKLKELAGDTGGEITFTSDAKKIPEIVQRIETELRSQYILSYRTDSSKPDGEFRAVTVACDKPEVSLRTMRGYIP